MGIILTIIGLAVVGLVTGALARLALPGRDPMTLWETMAIGVLGSLIAGIVTWAIWGRGAGFLLSFLVAVGLVYLVRRSRGGGLASPGS
jgi:uncharacterized membrane protein YeaQ/YmgE (transglycosylase-associated protein family)